MEVEKRGHIRVKKKGIWWKKDWRKKINKDPKKEGRKKINKGKEKEKKKEREKIQNLQPLSIFPLSPSISPRISSHLGPSTPPPFPPHPLSRERKSEVGIIKEKSTLLETTITTTTLSIKF